MSQRFKADNFDIFGSPQNSGYLVNRKSNNKWFEVDLFSSHNRSLNNNATQASVDQKIINLWLVVLFIGLSVLGARTAYLQLFEGTYFRSIAEGNRVRILDIKATRGVIYDRNNQLLVENIPSFSLVIVPVDLSKKTEDRQQIANELAKISQKPANEIFDILMNQSPYSYQPVVIAENLTQDQAIAAKILAGRFLGIGLQIDNSRNYLKSGEVQSFSHLLGYTGKIDETKLQEYLAKGYLIDDSVGKSGLEMSYEKELKGINGRQQVEVDATGEAKEILAYQKPVSGDNLVLTIDVDLQKQAELSLKKVLQKTNKKRGVVIATDPTSGGILALVSLPAYDNNLFSRGISQKDLSDLISDPNHPLYSRAVSGEYPPGSTFKLIVACAALQEKLINQNTSFMSTGGISVSRWFFPDWKAGGHGLTNVTKAIAESVNTFFYIIGGGYNDFKGLGVANIKKYAEQFGLNKELGVDLPNESAGFVPSEEWKEKIKKEIWYIGDTYHFAIGQGDLSATPLQVAFWTLAIANGGTLYQPHLLKSVLDNNNQVIKEIKPVVLSQNFIDPKNIAIVGQGMRQTVLSGSGRYFGSLPVEVAAKTGTAEWASNKPTHAWVTTFAPYKDPKIVVTVLVEEGGEGSSVAAPVAYDILNWWAENRLNPTTTPNIAVKP
ncbi:MAG: penicillin-binding protein 2 [Candidatus Buchananbacteria bacterium]